MKRHLAIIVIAVLAVSALAGKKQTSGQKGISPTDQRKAEYIFMQAQSEK